ncbi:MAG: NADH-quinone oxidoreductase subunit C [Chthonomonadales bacterium]|nr:NADH-quinone oxidoreductase subunit C [Chthonomonadales bacterium]
MMNEHRGEEALRAAGGDGIEALAWQAGPRQQAESLRMRVSARVLRDVCRTLRDHPDLRFDYPGDLCGTDLGSEIHLWYRLWSHEHGRSAIIDVILPSSDAVVPTVSDIWPGYDWHERECFDMLGVRFEGHPRDGDPARMRILLPEDWEGHPFRKDYQPVFSGDPLHGPQETN